MKNGSKIAVHKGGGGEQTPFPRGLIGPSHAQVNAPCTNTAPWGKANTVTEGNAPSSRARHSVTSCCRAHLVALTKVTCELLLCLPDKRFFLRRRARAGGLRSHQVSGHPSAGKARRKGGEEFRRG